MRSMLLSLTLLTLSSACRTDDDKDDEPLDTDVVVAFEDLDGDGYTTETDCNDGDAAINPGASEDCNGVDDDCDASIDEGVTGCGSLDPADDPDVPELIDPDKSIVGGGVWLQQQLGYPAPARPAAAALARSRAATPMRGGPRSGWASNSKRAR